MEAYIEDIYPFENNKMNCQKCMFCFVIKIQNGFSVTSLIITNVFFVSWRNTYFSSCMPIFEQGMENKKNRCGGFQFHFDLLFFLTLHLASNMLSLMKKTLMNWIYEQRIQIAPSYNKRVLMQFLSIFNRNNTECMYFYYWYCMTMWKLCINI